MEQSSIMTRTTPCPICQTPVTREAVMFMGRELYAGLACLCQACDDKRALEEATAKAAKSFRDAWEKIVPASYQAAKIEAVSAELQKAATWLPKVGQTGLGIHGPSGCGKTHCMALMALSAAIPFRWMTGAALRALALNAAMLDGADRDDARKTLSALRNVPMLVIDDLAEVKFTEAFAEKLFELLEHRNTSLLLTCWTAQHGPGRLAAKIAAGNGVDQGTADAIERRLVQHSVIFEG
jgi:DNA replication protein DnaC